MNEEDNGHKVITPVTEVDGEIFFFDQPVQWTAKVERFRPDDDQYSAKIVLQAGGREPQIGDLVLVRGWKGAEFIAPIIAVRNAKTTSVYVITADPPWRADSYLARQERSWTEAIDSRLQARKEARLMDVREQENLCVVCGEPDLDACACVRAQRERIEQMAREAAAQEKRAAEKAAEQKKQQEWNEKCRAHNERADAARSNLTEEAVRAAIEKTDGGLAAAGRELGIDEYENQWDGEASWYARETKNAYPFLSNWIKNNASDLKTYARELREKAGK